MFERDFQEFLRYLTIERGLSQNTANAYRRDLEDFTAWLADRGVDSFRAVKREMIVDYLENSLSERAMEPATIARRLVAIKMFFRHLEEEELIPTDPAAVIESPKLWRALPDFLTVAEVGFVAGLVTRSQSAVATTGLVAVAYLVLCVLVLVALPAGSPTPMGVALSEAIGFALPLEGLKADVMFAMAARLMPLDPLRAFVVPLVWVAGLLALARSAMARRTV